MDHGCIESTHIMVCRLSVSWRVGTTVKDLEVLLPCSCLSSTRAEDVAAALFKTMPYSLPQWKGKCSTLFVILTTDSAPSCLRLGRHLNSFTPVLSGVCRMHQGCLCLVALLKLGNILPSLFCSALLLRRRRVQSLLRSRLRIHIQENLEIVWAAPADDEKKMSRLSSG